MTPETFRAIREALGLSAEGMARVLGAGSGRTIRRWEAGERAIPGTVVTLVSLIDQHEVVRRALGIEPR